MHRNSWLEVGDEEPGSSLKVTGKHNSTSWGVPSMSLCCCRFSSQSCVWHCCSPPGSSVHGISPARILEWVTISYSRGSSWSRDWTHASCISCIGRQVLYQLGHLGIPPVSRVQGVINIYNLKYYRPNSMQSVHTFWRVCVGIMKYMSPASPS